MDLQPPIVLPVNQFDHFYRGAGVGLDWRCGRNGVQGTGPRRLVSASVGG